MTAARAVLAGVGRRRQLAAFALAVALLPALTAVLAAARPHLSLADDLLVYLLAVLAVTVVGGLWPAVVAALAAGLSLNWYFTPPVHTWTIESPQNLAALVLFVAAAVTVSAVVHGAARQSAASRRSAAEAQALVTLAQTVLTGADDADAVLAHLAASTGVRAELRELADGHWLRVAGPPLPDDGGRMVDVRPGLRLHLAGDADIGPRLLDGFVAQAAAALDRSRLRAQAARAQALAETDRMRAALLAAVSHDLRTPLAAIKAGVSSLRQTDVEWSPADRAELVATVEEGADRLERIIANLLDMTRVHTGTVRPVVRPVALDEVLPLAVAGPYRERVAVHVPEDLPLMRADPGLLERVLANLVENALRFSPLGRPVTVTAEGAGERVAVRVVDHGPGVPEPALEQIFEPFRQLGDGPAGSGVGLGLAVARGFTRAMGGSLSAGSTLGGGLTMTLWLPVAAADPAGTRP